MLRWFGYHALGYHAMDIGKGQHLKKVILFYIEFNYCLIGCFIIAIEITQ